MNTRTSPTLHTVSVLSTRGLTALRHWAEQLSEVAQSLRSVPRGITYFPLPQTKPLTEKGEPQVPNLAQKTHPETEISLVASEPVAPTGPGGFAVQAPGPQMPLLSRNGRIVLCRLGR